VHFRLAGRKRLRKEAGYVALGFVLAVVMITGYYQLSGNMSPPVATEAFRESTLGGGMDMVTKTTFVPMIPAMASGVALVCAFLTYGIAKRRSS
jgi:O-antigen/teichoic acid export membrane protein